MKAARLAIGQVVTLAIAFGGLRVLTELVPPSVFGAYILWIGAITLARNTISIPLSQTILRFDAHISDDQRSILYTRLIAWWMPAVLVVIGIVGLVAAISPIPIPLVAVVLSLVLLPMWCFRDVEAAILNARQRHDVFTINECFDAISRALGPIGAAILIGVSYPSLLFGTLFGGAVSLVAFWVSAGRGWKWGGRPKTDDMSTIIRDARAFMVPLFPASLLGWINGMSDRYLIAMLLGLDAAGLWAAAYALTSRPFLLVSRTTSLIFRPRYMSSLSVTDSPDAIKAFSIWITTVAVLVSLGVLGFTVFPNAIVGLLLASKYSAVADVVPWIAAGNGLLILSRVVEARLQGQNRTDLVLIARAAGAAISVVAVAWMGYAFGLLGAAIACPLYFGLQLLLLWRFSFGEVVDAARSLKSPMQSSVVE